MFLSLLLIALCLSLVFIAMLGEKRVPWASDLRRIRPGAARYAEWMAPDTVVETVTTHYMEAIHWLQDAPLGGKQIRSQADLYLSGEMLQQFEDWHGNRQFTGVLRSDHQTTVRHFSENGDECFIIDVQASCRMATYEVATRTRIATQDMGDAAVVYRMRYNHKERRWKIDGFVQQLPSGWQQPDHVQLQSELSMPAGRDH